MKSLNYLIKWQWQWQWKWKMKMEFECEFVLCLGCAGSRGRSVGKRRVGGGAEEAAADGLLGHADQSARGRVREEQVPLRLQAHAALQAAQTHRDSGKRPVARGPPPPPPPLNLI